MRNVFLGIALVFLSCSELFAQPSFMTDSLDSYIERGMKDWDIPGLAIAVVKDGKVVVMKGYGVRDLGTKEPVDENTLFMIASNSKLFTATSLAQLEYDKQLSLDDKITKYFPLFRLADRNTNDLVTIRDMLSHHLGTKTFQGDFTFWNSALTRQQIMDKMKLLKPSQNFRQSYGYCNSCFLTAGEIIPVVSGKPWEVYVYDSLVEPLGMSHTQTLGYNMSQMPDAARPYSNAFYDSLQLLPYDLVDNLAPAGSMVSCVSDIAHWLQMQLDSGRYEGKQVLPWAVVKRTREMQTIVSSTKSGYYPSNYYGYGMGIFQRDYNGRQVFWHTGGADGFVTNTCFVPEENLGITILTNNDNQNFFEALRYMILDAYLDMPYFDRSAMQLEWFAKERHESLNRITALKARLKGQKPSMPLINYSGTYDNELYGFISIVPDGEDLKIKFLGHKNLVAKLQYMDNDEWLMTYNNPAFGIFPIKFKTEFGRVSSVDIKMNDFIEYDAYTFIKN
ncbi:MAG TPA: serine hydrolase [Panacibacter sp.]|nr:serine hydrolase [Panacibacter sp.]HNP45727.1 serine hydrolase [Panacibacter sp.]